MVCANELDDLHQSRTRETWSSRTYWEHQQIEEEDPVNGESGSFSNSEYEVEDFVSTDVDGEFEGKYRGGGEA